jgi:hypothetical protein
MLEKRIWGVVVYGALGQGVSTRSSSGRACVWSGALMRDMLRARKKSGGALAMEGWREGVQRRIVSTRRWRRCTAHERRDVCIVLPLAFVPPRPMLTWPRSLWSL